MFSWQRSFEEQGFAVLPERLTTLEVSDLIDDLAGIPRERGKAGIRHLLERPAIHPLAHDPRFLGVVQQMLGPGALPFRATLFDKSSGRNWLIAWHQDTALPLCQRHESPGWGPWSVKDGIIYAHAPADALNQVVALRIHLDKSSVENGPLRVLPATHKLGVLTDDEIHGLSIKIPELTCTIALGGVLAMRPLLIHASSKSQIEIPRRVLHIEYATSQMFHGNTLLARA